MRPFSYVVAVVLFGLLALACGPAPAAPQPAAQPAQASAPPAAAPAKPAAEGQPAAPAKAVAEAKPAAPAQPAAAAKPAQPAAPAKEAQRIVMGIAQLSTSQGVYSAAVAKLLHSKVPDVNITVAEYGGVVNNLKKAKGGEVDFSMGDHLITYKAYTGDLKGWEGDPQKDVRLLWLFDASALATVVNERAGIKDLGDLNGKPFSAGAQGSNAEVVTQETFGLLDIKPQWYRGSFTEVAQAFKDRRVVGFVKATPLSKPDAILLDVMTAQPIRILGLPKDAVQKVQGKFSYLKTIEIPAGVYQGDWNKTPIVSWGTYFSFWATTRFPESLAYQFTKVVLQNKAEQVDAYPALKDFDIGRLTAEAGVIPLHKGAMRALREAGYQVPPALIAPEAR
ncbi:MAG: TAXI family TRAP transporter solute-binding subunit [Chloroflexi bacterium]|nr:TAXI family TRAP transporter solute-binding subunit [Chloroflexota bacterium]